VIQSAIIFLLGFLCATFVALLALPPVWRRAVRLTRRNIEASLPLTREEMLASRDQQRAEYAMALRRVEMQLAEQRTKSSSQTVEASRQRRKMSRLLTDRDQLHARITELEQLRSSFQSEIQARDAIVKQFAAKTEEVEDALSARIDELSNLGQLYEEAKLTSTARHVEVLARETEIERLGREMAKLRRERTRAVKKLQTIDINDKTVADGIEYERRRIRELQEKLDRSIAEISDRDDKISRREREIERLRARTRESVSDDLKVIELQKENLQLVSELEDLQARLEESDTRLREAMQDLAARVVVLTASREGQRDPILRALDKEAPKFPDRTVEPPPSLEERILRVSREIAKLS
jgi:chromosome segregation ATPase